MTTTKKFALGLGIAGGALLITWLLTGDRRRKTSDFLSRKAEDLRKAADRVRARSQSEQHYL